MIFDRRPVPNPLGGLREWGQNVKIYLFRTWSFCISNLRESWMQHHGSKYFAHRALLIPIPWPCDQKVKIQLFKNMVRLHIKLNHECRNVVANILPPDPSNHKKTLGVGSNVKINFFKTWSCCISNEMESRMQPHGSKYFPRRPHLPGLGGQKVKI